MSAQREFWQRGRAPPAPERKTHIALADTLRLSCRRDWLWSHIPSGEHRSEQTGALLKRMGLKRGLLDFLFIDPNGRHHWLELKRGLEDVTDEQFAFMGALRSRGVPCAVARNYEAAVRQLQQWGALP